MIMMKRINAHRLRLLPVAIGFWLVLFFPFQTKGHDPEQLTSLATNVILSQTTGLKPEIYDAVTDGCMKWPTGVQKIAEETLAQSDLFDPDSAKLLQIIANGYAQEGSGYCFVNIDIIYDEIGNLYFDNGVKEYGALARFDVWRTSFMIADRREKMQSIIQARVGNAVEELVNDINRSKEIVQENDSEFREEFILLHGD